MTQQSHDMNCTVPNNFRIPVSGYMRVVRRRTLTKWTNLHLHPAGLSIDDICDLIDSVLAAKLITLLSGNRIAVSIFEPERKKRQEVGWKNVCSYLASQDFPAECTDPVSFSQDNIDPILALVSNLVLHYLIIPLKVMFSQTKGTARDFILSWVRQKLPNRNVTNFDKDWQNGVLICELVNATQPGLIPPQLYADLTNSEGNAKLGMQIAHDAFGIPQVISPFDLASSQLDELSLLTYLALFCKYENLLNGSTKKGVEGLPETQDIPCKAYGSGLRSSELGKVAEFVVELNGAKPTDITIAIECKPLQGAVHDDKPDLSVRPLNRNTYCVKYLPTRPGNYVISILHCGAHILRSPFYLTVPELNGVHTRKSLPKDLMNGASSNASSNALSTGQNSTYSQTSLKSTNQSSSPILASDEKNSFSPSSTTDGISRRIPLNAAEGQGLIAGEVGRIGRFSVITDNSTKGPLSVCISCPAVSIPVPYVKSTKKDCYTEHDVLYVPTEPGAYEVFIKWGDLSINGSPFKVFINNVSEDVVNNGMSRAVSDLGGRGKIRVYYAAMSTNLKIRKDNELLEKFLKEKGVSSRSDFDEWIALDVGMRKLERDKVFSKAGTRQTPMVFANDVFIGNYEDVLILDKQGLFDEYFR